jgi:hypothetical protein
LPVEIAEFFVALLDAKTYGGDRIMTQRLAQSLGVAKHNQSDLPRHDVLRALAETWRGSKLYKSVVNYLSGLTKKIVFHIL